MRDSKIQYLTTGKYQPNENCEWSVNDGKVALSFAIIISNFSVINPIPHEGGPYGPHTEKMPDNSELARA